MLKSGENFFIVKNEQEMLGSKGKNAFWLSELSTKCNVTLSRPRTSNVSQVVGYSIEPFSSMFCMIIWIEIFISLRHRGHVQPGFLKDKNMK